MDQYYKPLFTGLVLAFLMFAQTAYAQFTVEGDVTDAQTGEPIIGATILHEPTNTGTTTDIEGTFTLELPGSSAEITISFIGYVTQTIEVDEESDRIQVKLKPDVAKLDEIVVSGLATGIKRENLANAVSSVSAEELLGASEGQTLSSNLYGKITGANVSSNSGAPGGGFSIQLRGITSINGQTQPLYIVDGVYYSNEAIPNGSNSITAAAGAGSNSNQDNPVNRIADLDPDDIQSIEVLKGASAAAIYGQRASGGVVIISTKRGSGGEAKFSVSQSTGITTIRNKLGTREFTADKAEASFGPTGRQLFEEAQAANRFIDYEEELYGQEGILSKSAASASFGNETTSMFISGSLQNDEGIIETTGFEKQSLRANLDHRFGPNFKMQFSSNYVHSESKRGLTNNDNTGTTFGVAMTATPNFIDLRKDENGVYPDHPFNTSNQLQTRDLLSNTEDVNRVTSSVQFEYKLLQNTNHFLRLNFNGGVDFFNQQNKIISPQTLQFERISGNPGTLIENASRVLNTNVNLLLVHTYNTGNNITLTSQAGYTSFNNDRNSILSVAQDVLGTQTNIDQATVLSADQTRVFQRDRGFFLQEEFNFDDKYIVTAGFRGDKSDRNGDVNQLFFYPKASAAWNIAKEDFWNSGHVDNLKLRAAYGETGNLSTFGAKFTSLSPANISGLGGAIITNSRGTDDIIPERKKEIETGIDATMFNDKLSVEFTLFQNKVKNLLLRRELEPSSGFNVETFNSGELRNRGVELSFNIYPITSTNFEWTSTLNYWKIESKITDLPVPAFDVGGFGTSLGVFRIEEGKSATQIVGIDPQTDGSGNLVLDGSGNPIIEQKKLGDGAADFQMSWSNNFNVYKNFDLSFLMHWKKGGDNINLSELLFDLNGTTDDFDDTDKPVPDFRLQAAGLTAQTPNGPTRLGLLGVSSAHFVQDASYLRMREIGLYYTVPLKFTTRYLSALERIKIGVSANNLFTITPYDSFDPEVSNFGNQPVGRGIEVTPFPASKQFFFHVNLDF